MAPGVIPTPPFEIRYNFGMSYKKPALPSSTVDSWANQLGQLLRLTLTSYQMDRMIWT